MKKLFMATIVCLSLSVAVGYAQIKNAQTVSVKISGNCGMCESTIEKAAKEDKVSMADWDKDTKMATITYNAKKTDLNAVLKKIALAGYDSKEFLAPDAAYDKLPGCCKYDRTFKTEMTVTESPAAAPMSGMHTDHEPSTMATMSEEKNQLAVVFDNYFTVKDALVKSDAKLAAANAGTLLEAINTVKMGELAMDVHTEWMKQLVDIKASTEKIKGSSDVATQRKAFISLSDDIYAIMKLTKTDAAVYYQHCPMANGGKGANWLSKDSNIKNPYYGSMMLTCGSTVETLK